MTGRDVLGKSLAWIKACGQDQQLTATSVPRLLSAQPFVISEHGWWRRGEAHGPEHGREVG